MDENLELFEVAIVRYSEEGDVNVTMWIGMAESKNDAKVTALARHKNVFDETSEVFVRPFCQ